MAVPCLSRMVHLVARAAGLAYIARSSAPPAPLTFSADAGPVPRGRRGHMEDAQALTDTSTRGLLPQLTDVLYALAESHAMLLRKVRSIRFEYSEATSSVVSFAEDSTDALIVPSTDSGQLQLVDATSWPIMEATTATRTDRAEPTASRIGIVSSEVDRVPQAATPRDVDVRGVDGRVAPADAATADSQRSEMNAKGSTQTSSQPDGSHRFEAEQSHPLAAESEGRNYNFFDDLDARLAGLGEQEPEQFQE